MASKSKNVAKGRVTGSAGRFGPRYGRFCRKMVNESEKISRAKHLCPMCDTIAVKRVGTGIWAVSYTHLTLPTILLVQISVVAVSLKKKNKKQSPDGEGTAKYTYKIERNRSTKS
eukprot:TRINITY_DN23585_c0_g1_i2.p1 TRINITY_DN23585_c0_g1~~TRINITY_DN23585_c0_g1_i2.p1  ORF type:complete len:115 (-),score=24.16 TRINITY_DN23585_c0_g1_i2:46-390(-)